MSEHYDEAMERLWLSCDAPGCPNTLEARDLAFGPTPGPHTGWVTSGKGTDDRRDYCEEHADQL